MSGPLLPLRLRRGRPTCLHTLARLSPGLGLVLFPERCNQLKG